ncbi:unnamed protein product [Phytophthora lilii]|uniref:Unnamed protein product n=1 Tax=Phytophthora lilii TaxID=2077276 RepID=A0A9W6WRH1_9STRA|nr:unnamed protein product [Phytophthora lilii]
MPWLARHDPVIDWRTRTVVRFGNAGQSVEDTTDRATVSDGPGNVAHASPDACGLPAQTETSAAVSDGPVQAATTPGVIVNACVARSPASNLIGSDLQGLSTSRLWGDDGASTNEVDVRIHSDMRGNPAIRHGCYKTTSTKGVDANLIGLSSTGDSADWRRISSDTSAPGADAATSSADGCKRLAPEKACGLACSRAARRSGTPAAGLDSACRRATTTEENLSMAGPGQGTNGAGLQKKKMRKRKQRLQRRPQSGPETKQEPSAGQTLASTEVETLIVLKQTSTGLQYRKMTLENPPTRASEVTSLPVMSWNRFARDLYDGRIEQICILSDVERMKSEAEELKQIVAESGTESKPSLSEKSKKERFNEQSWDSLKSSPYYDILREHRDVLPDEIPAELPTDKGVQHEIDLVPGTKYCVTWQWPLPRDQVKAIDDFSETRRKAGQVRESKFPYSAPTICVKKPLGG